MEEVKIVWLYNPADGNKLVGSKPVDLNYKLSDGETFTKPEDGLYEPLQFDLATQVWVGASKEEWEAAHPDPVPMPTPQQTLMAGVMKDLANVKNGGKSQDELNANVMKQVAQLSIANEAKDKVNAQLLKDVAGLKIQLGSLQSQVEEATAALAHMQVSTSTSQSTQSSTVADPTVAVTEPVQPTETTESTQPTQPKED